MIVYMMKILIKFMKDILDFRPFIFAINSHVHLCQYVKIIYFFVYLLGNMLL